MRLPKKEASLEAKRTADCNLAVAYCLARLLCPPSSLRVRHGRPSLRALWYAIWRLTPAMIL